MAQLKVLNRIEEKLDRLLAIMETQPDPAPPVEPDPALIAASLDYDTYSAAEIIKRVPSLSAEERAALYEYERANQQRKTVLEALA